MDFLPISSTNALALALKFINGLQLYVGMYVCFIVIRFATSYYYGHKVYKVWPVGTIAYNSLFMITSSFPRLVTESEHFFSAVIRLKIFAYKV